MLHPHAHIGNAVIGKGVRIDAGAVIDDGAVIGDGCHIYPHAHIYSSARLGQNVQVFNGAIVGSPPQAIKFAGEESYLEVGDNSIIREYTTLNCGLGESYTHIGKGCLVMAYTHIGHDCILEDHVILANGVQLGGHVRLGEGSVIGGNTAVHQFSCIGRYSFVGGTLKVDRDIPPYTKALGNPLSWVGCNSKGFEKAELSIDEQKLWKAFYKAIYRKGMKWAQIEEQYSALFGELETWKVYCRNGMLGGR